tara:strand:+ start:512 stop:1021 length:510 start_codon:yes stop_codon:yes gene_type:complete
MIKVVLTGPECSGKTTLSESIATKLCAPLVQEYAREYLNNLKRDYCYADLLKIAKGQVELEKKTIDNNPHAKLIICDTNIQVLKMWSQIKYSKCDPFILHNQDIHSFYILCSPEFTWEHDPLRENPNNRMALFKKYYQDLQQEKYNFIIAKGSNNTRISYVIDNIMQML